MHDDYNMNANEMETHDEQHRDLISRLKNLPRAKAPENFREKLLAKIEQAESAEKDNITPLYKQPAEKESFWQERKLRPIYGIAAAIVIGFIIYQLYPVSKQIASQQNASPEIAQNVPQQ